MGIYSTSFRAPDPRDAIRRAGELVQRQSGRAVRVEDQPGGYHAMVDGLGVVVLEVGDERHVLLRGLSRLWGGRTGRTARVADALASLGGTLARSPGRLRFSFAGAPPSGESIAAALGGATLHRFGAGMVLRSWGSSPVEVALGSEQLELEALLFFTGPLYAALLRAMEDVGAERVPGPRSGPPR